MWMSWKRSGWNESLAGGDLLNIVIHAASIALEREGSACRIGLEDFRAAIGSIRTARQQHGAFASLILS